MRKLMTLLGVILVLSMILAACQQAAPTEAPKAEPTKEEAAPPAEPTNTQVAIEAKPTEPPPPTEVVAMYKQAPTLDGVSGLPPVEERLPVDPVVTKVREAIGKYGGTLYTASWWPEAGNVQLYFAVEAPIKWKEGLDGYEPALVESYEWSEDGMTFTMHMRPGLKWSDGEPYTSEDWRFYWEDIAKNEDYKVISVPGYLRKSDGTPIDMEFPDEYTVVWKSDQPLWIAPFYMAQGFWEYAKNMMQPAHYLKQYHPKYTPTATYEDLEKMNKWWQTPGFPCLFAWCSKSVAEDGSSMVFGRNPYYWRVDEEGNQLPYIEEINVEIVSDEQVRILNCAQGKYDTAFRICGSPNDIPTLADGAEAGNFRFLENYMNGAGAWPGYMVNQYYVEGGKNYENDTPEKAAEVRAVLRDKRFRQALSLGLDRQRMIDVAWNGIGEAKAATISPQSWHFVGDKGQQVYKDWAASYANYDPDTANAMLDEMGLVDKDGDGFRDLPSGEPIAYTLDITDWGGSLKVQTDAAAEAAKQWGEALKVKVEVKNLQGQPDVDTRTNEGYYMLRGAHISEIDIWTYPDWIFPIVNRYMFPLEGRWWAKGKETCVPPADKPYDCGVKPEDGSPAQQLQALYEKGLQAKTIEERHQIVWDAIKVIETEGPFVIGVAGDQPMPIIIKNYMKNVLDYGVVGPWAPATPGNQIASTWWMDK